MQNTPPRKFLVSGGVFLCSAYALSSVMLPHFDKNVHTSTSFSGFSELCTTFLWKIVTSIKFCPYFVYGYTFCYFVEKKSAGNFFPADPALLIIMLMRSPADP